MSATSRPVIDFAGAGPDDVSNLLRQLPKDDTVEVIFRNIPGEHSIEIYKKIWLLVPNLCRIWFHCYSPPLISFIDMFTHNITTRPFFKFMLESRANLYTICHNIPETVLLSMLRINLFMPEGMDLVKIEGFVGKPAHEILTTPKLLTSKDIYYVTKVLYYVSKLSTFDLIADIRGEIYAVIEHNYDAFVARFDIETKPEPPCAVQFADIGEFETV